MGDEAREKPGEAGRKAVVQVAIDARPMGYRMETKTYNSCGIKSYGDRKYCCGL